MHAVPIAGQPLSLRTPQSHRLYFASPVIYARMSSQAPDELKRLQAGVRELGLSLPDDRLKQLLAYQTELL